LVAAGIDFTFSVQAIEAGQQRLLFALELGFG
jgi:hypothetical protein